jgi:Tfp pilus assembly protein FimT
MQKIFRFPGKRTLGNRLTTSAFTLVEMLVVIGIVVLMAGIAIPVVSGMKQSTDITKAAYSINGILDQGRAYAMANNTYVYVGFTEVDVAKDPALSPQTTGIGRVAVAMVASRDGTRGYDPNDGRTTWKNSYNNGNNLVALGKLQQFENIHLADSLGTPPTSGKMTRPSVTEPNRIGAVGAGKKYIPFTPFTWPLGNPLSTSGGQYYFDKIIIIDPQGVPRVPIYSGNPISEYMEVGLQQSKGNVSPAVPTEPNVGNHVAMVINGLTGSVTMYRP